MIGEGRRAMRTRIVFSITDFTLQRQLAAKNDIDACEN